MAELIEEIEQVEKKNNFRLIALITAVAVVGVLSGWGLSRMTGKTTGGTGTGSGKQEKISALPSPGGKVEVGKTYGRNDDTFRDWATGALEKNTKNNVGTHILKREGGESQTAYLTSSVLDLDLFVGRKVEVWGQTIGSGEVAWYMDIGRVKVVE